MSETKSVKDRLPEILAAHAKWLRAEPDGVRADLSGADLYGADLSGADLSGADLSGAYLYRANLSGAYLGRADLSGAYLDRANLSGADLDRANLDRAYLGPRSIVPDEGAFAGWKKLGGGIVAMLGIPAEARRVSSLVGRKCRAEWVTVIALFDTGDNLLPNETEGRSIHDSSVVYRAGQTVYPDDFDDDIRIECSNGIHFFITRQEAKDFTP